MKKELSHAQYGAYVLFEQKFTIRNYIKPAAKCACEVSCIIGILLWLLLAPLWAAILCTFFLVVASYLAIVRIVSFYEKKFFEENPERFLLWQRYYLHYTIAAYLRMKESFPIIADAYAPIDGVGEVGVSDVILQSSVAQAHMLNVKNASHMAFFKHQLLKAKDRYDNTLAYLSEINLTLSQI